MKQDILKKLSDDNNGYLFTAEVLRNGISKTYLAKFVKKMNMKELLTEFMRLRISGRMNCIFYKKQIQRSFFQGKQRSIFTGLQTGNTEELKLQFLGDIMRSICGKRISR